ncbi:MAG TPA: carotenoid 1,2-hydratase [Candidatus Limnocylindrales bacterium]|jgi:predicted secreted hydrolase
MSPRRPVQRGIAAVVALAFAIAGCGGAPILANAPILFPAPPTASPGPSTPADPIPITWPRDDGPHDRLTEWWYYTGHLRADDGRTFGFEAVVFRAERGAVPVAWASHVAVTDESGDRFYYAQRSEIGPQVDRSPLDQTGTPTGFDLEVGGLSPALIANGAPAVAAPWRLQGANGTDRIEATLTPAEVAAAGAPFGFMLDLHTLKPPVAHQGNGFIDFGPAGSSYYYSRTRLSASGVLQLRGETLHVTGIAWFDHQWGNFVSVGAGGWNWFAINLDDGTDITLSTVLDEHAAATLQYGTLVKPSGEVVNLADGTNYSVSSGGRTWFSPSTGVTYPADWFINLIGSNGVPQRVLYLAPTVGDQELDARATTGVAYWEGSETVTDVTSEIYGGGKAETPVVGKAYVEITRYDAPGG